MGAYDSTPSQNKARKARTLAAETNLTKYGSRKLVQEKAKADKVKLTPAQEEREVAAMQTRRMNDRNKTASRAEFIARRDDPKNKKEVMKKAKREANIAFEKAVKASKSTKKKGM